MQAALEQFLYRVFRFNPAVVILELRTRLRGQRAYGVLFFYALIVSIAMVITFLVLADTRQSDGGHSVLVVMAMVQLTLVLLIMPGYSAATIALEREKKTLELVKTSTLTPTDIVSGKLLTIMAFAVILLLAGLPVSTWSLMLGGVSPVQVLMVYSYLLVLSLEVTGLGLVISTISERAVTAVVVTYGVLFFFLVGMPGMILSLLGVLLGSNARSVLGLWGAVGILLILAGVIAGLFYMVFQSLLRRTRIFSSRFIGVVIPQLVAIASGLLIFYLGVNWVSGVANWRFDILMIVHPYVGLASMLSDDLASSIVTSASSSGAVRSFSIWLLNMGIAVIFAAFLWFLAIAMYRLKSKKG